MNRGGALNNRFLHGSDLRAGILSALKGDRRDLAVAYIGDGALLRAGLKDAMNTRVVCDLFSGFCNPTAMRELRDAGADIKNVRGFHAKVYLGENSAVICSANLSSNGFGEGEKEQKWGLEAGALVEDPTELKEVATWFDEIFRSGDAVDLDDGRLDEAWAKRPRRPGLKNDASKSGSLLKHVISNPSDFRALGFVFTDSTAPRAEREAAVQDAVGSHPDLTDEVKVWIDNAYTGWPESSVKSWPSEFVAYHIGERGGFYISAHRLAVRSEQQGYILANRDWPGIVGGNFQGASTAKLLKADKSVAVKILKRLRGGRVFRTAEELAEWYHKEFGA